MTIFKVNTTSGTQTQSLSTGGEANQTQTLNKASSNFFTTYGNVINDYNRIKNLLNNIINVDISNVSNKYINADFVAFNNLLLNTNNLVNTTIDICQNNFLPSNFTSLTQEDFFNTLNNIPSISSIYDSNLIELLKQNSFDTINVLQQAGSEYIKIVNLQSENETLKSYKNILESSELLTQYLEEQQTTSTFFSAETTITTNVELNEWYSVYLQRYGPPGDGIFDTELLANIIQELINDPNSDVTEDTLLY